MKRKPLPPGEVFEAYVRFKAGDYTTPAERDHLKRVSFPARYGNWDTFEADKLAVELRQKLACDCRTCRLN